MYIYIISIIYNTICIHIKGAKNQSEYHLEKYQPVIKVRNDATTHIKRYRYVLSATEHKIVLKTQLIIIDLPARLS